MKSFVLTLMGVFFLFSFQIFAQCPDANITDDGFHPEPDSLPCIVNDGTGYSETVQVNVPASFDTTISPFGTLTVTIDSIRIDQINNMPTGISYSCAPSDCVFEGGEAGCVTFSGSTNDAAQDYVLEIIATAWVTAPIVGSQTYSGFDISQAGLEYFLTVINSSDPCPHTPGTTTNQLAVSVSASANGLCVGETSDLTASASNGTPPYTFAWSPAPSLSSTTDSNTTATPTATTTYNVTVTDDNSDQATGSITLNVAALPVANFSSSDQGNGDYSFDASNTTGAGLTYSWDFGDNSSAGTGQTTTHTYSAEGDYDVTLTVTDACDSTSSFTQNVSVIFTSINSFADAVNYIKVYPNPNSGNFELQISTNEIKSNYSLSIIDLQGKVLYQESVSNNALNFRKSMNLNHLNSGVYFLRINSDGLSYVDRLMIQK